jgi:hypothetical protein
MTPIEDVLRDIWQVTMALRATKGLKERYAIWKRDTPLGRFFSTKGGKFLALFLWSWIIISSLNTLGITDIKPLQLIQAAVKSYFKIQ